MADMMDKTVMSIMTAFVAIILLASAFIPTVLPLIDEVRAQDSVLATLLGTVVIIAVVGVLLGIIKSYKMKQDYDE